MSAVPGSYEPSIAERLRWFLRRQWERAFPAKSNLVIHAEQELRAAGLYDEDSDYGGMLADAVMELVKVYSRQGHSGASAGRTMAIFQKVGSYEPLCPLKGTDDEWFEYMDGQFQNRRCSHVFKDGKDGQAYDSTGRIFREPSGACYTGKGSRVPITFPYTPKREYVDVPASAD